jgi:hypothetical protein
MEPESGFIYQGRKMSDINTALVGLLGVLIGGYTNNFAAEDYRRFRDGNTISGAIAGELSSHLSALPRLHTSLSYTLENLGLGHDLTIREVQLPSDPVFEKCIEKLGALGAKNAEEVVFIYQQIRAFRTSFTGIMKYHKEMTPDELKVWIEGAIETIDRSHLRGVELVNTLRAYANRSYFKERFFLAQTFAADKLTIFLAQRFAFLRSMSNVDN